MIYKCKKCNYIQANDKICPQCGSNMYRFATDTIEILNKYYSNDRR